MKLVWLLPIALMCAGCPGTPKEAPPPAESYTIASAAPGALGAFAAGTKSAPQAVTPRGTPTFNPGDDDSGPAEEEDGGATAPDAGTNGSEDLPL
jgi:hypothetical protein